MADAREERKRRSEERLRKKRRNTIIVLTVFISVVLGVAGTLYVFVHVYEKPPADLAVILPEKEIEGLSFFDWKSQAKQKFRKGPKQQKYYLSQWTVTARGYVKNTTSSPLELTGVRMEVLSKRGAVIDRDDSRPLSLRPGDGLNLWFSVDVSGKPPARVRLVLLGGAPSE